MLCAILLILAFVALGAFGIIGATISQVTPSKPEEDTAQDDKLPPGIIADVTTQITRDP